MITHRPAIDWLTLTTYSQRSILEADALLHSIVGDQETTPSRVRQYEGVAGDGFFIGDAEQRGKAHFMLRLSGDLADKFMFHPLKPSMECSRLDLQLTMDWQGNAYPIFRDSQDAITEHERGRGQRQRKVNAIMNADGFCTMYIGNRQSERFYRIYVKEHGEEIFLRFEVELKGKGGLAGRMYRELTRDKSKAVARLVGELKTLPEDDPLVRPFLSHLKGASGDIMESGRERSDPNTTLKWISKQVMPAWKRVLGNEDTRDRAVMMLGELVEFLEVLT